MLSRLEVAYLGTLRVVLLVAATLALLVTIGATITALPALGTMTGITGSQEPAGRTLSEFVQANRITDVQSTSEDTSDAAAPLPDQLAQASKGFAQYDSKNGGEQLKQKEWDNAFRSILDEQIPSPLREVYSVDVLKLSDQLARSKGKPLTDQRLYELVQFHLESFQSSAQAIESSKSAELAASMSKLVLAGLAFLIFVLVLFNFIFVKIERNLRPGLVPNEMAE